MQVSTQISHEAVLNQLESAVLLVKPQGGIGFFNEICSRWFPACDLDSTLEEIGLHGTESPLDHGDEGIYFRFEGKTTDYFRASENYLEDGSRLLSLQPANELFRNIIQLEESEHSLRNLIDVVPHAIFLKDSNRRFLIINQAVADHHKLDKVAMLGKRDEDFFSEEDARPFIEDEERILSTKEPLYIPEESFTTDEGDYKVMETIKVPFYIQSSKEWGILGVAIDITKRKLLQEEQTKFKLQYQKDLMKAVVETQERERKKIAEDLHDGLGQLLSAASMNLNALLTSQHLEENQHLNKSQHMIEHSIQEVRNITRNLMPNILKDFGLTVALEKLCEAFDGTKDLKFYFKSHNADEAPLDEQVAINVYRIAQEIINNALKHSKAHEIDIQLFVRDEELILQADDDGEGFDLNAMLKSGPGLGLKSIQNRVDLLNGTLDIDTSPGRGCSYSIIITM